MKIWLAGLVLLLINFEARAQDVSLDNTQKNEPIISRVFLNSVIYGVGAGTLVGIAAASNFHTNFEKNFDPTNIARGASYGLYGGILLGLYLTYLTPAGTPANPDGSTDGSQPQTSGETNPAGSKEVMYTAGAIASRPIRFSTRLLKSMSVTPILSDNGISGGMLSIRLAQF